MPRHAKLAFAPDERIYLLVLATAILFGWPSVFGTPASLAQDLTVDQRINTTDENYDYDYSQYRTTAAANKVTGTVCVVFYDNSRPGIYPGNNYSFASSSDRGQTWTVRGSVQPSSTYTSPRLFWRAKDGYFYLFSARSDTENPDQIYFRSTDDCQTFDQIDPIAEGAGPIGGYAVADNWPSSPFYGRIYTFDETLANYSDDGMTWSGTIDLNDGALANRYLGLRAAVGPDGALYTVHRYQEVMDANYRYTQHDFRVFRSLDGGNSFARLPDLLTDAIRQRSFEPFSCTLKGHLTYYPKPEFAVGADGVLHAIYTADTDGFNIGDVSNVYYRRSSDQGMTWGPEILLNDDGTLTDQFFPTLSIGDNNLLSAAWYDRRLDVDDNLMIDYYHTVSTDGGDTWSVNVRRSDVSSEIDLEPRETCRNIGYDQQVQHDGMIYLFWADHRQKITRIRNQSDVWTEAVPASDFILSPHTAKVNVCSTQSATLEVDVTPIGGFSDLVTLSVTGLPAGASASWSANPVMPSGSATLTLSNLNAAPFGLLPIRIVGQAGVDGPVREAPVTLEVVHTPLAFGAGTISPRYTLPIFPRVAFDWTYRNEGETGYNGAFESELEIATDEAFTNIVETARTATRKYQSPGLERGQTYYWHVRSRNACGWSPYSEVGIVKVNAPYPLVLLVDDDDDDPDLGVKYREKFLDLGYNLYNQYDVWWTAQKDDEPLLVDLEPYHTILWFTAGDQGQVGPKLDTESVLKDWFDQGQKCLIMTSREYHRDRGWTPLLRDTLGAADIDPLLLFQPTVHEIVTGTGALQGLGPYTLYPPLHPYTTYDALVEPGPNAEVVLTSPEGNAAIRTEIGTSIAYYFGIPLMSFPPQTARAIVLKRLLDECAKNSPVVFQWNFESRNFSGWGSSQ